MTPGAMPASILLVDDDPMTLKVVTRVLTREGYLVACCGSGSEALERLHTGGFGLMLTDWVMADLDGTKLVEQAGVLCPSMRCILMSGHPRPSFLPAQIPWLMKPIAVQVLLDMIAAELQIARDGASGAPARVGS